MSRRTTLYLTLAGVIAMGALVRFHPAASLPIWYDEADTWLGASARARWEGHQGITYGDFARWRHHFEHAPLGYLLPRVAMDLTGSESALAMRLPSLIFGVLCIPAAYWLARVAWRPSGGGQGNDADLGDAEGRLLRPGDAFALLVAALVAFDPNQVDQSRQARMYTLYAFELLLGAALAIRALRPPWEVGRRRRARDDDEPEAARGRVSLRAVATFAGLTLVLAALLWTTQLGMFVWVGLALGCTAALARLLADRRPGGAAVAGRMALGLVISYALAMALAFIAFERMFARLGTAGRGADMTIPRIARELATAAKDLISPSPAGLLVYPLAAVGLWLLARRNRAAALVVSALAIATVVLVFPFRRQHHFMDPRYLTALQPALWLGIAALAVGFRGRVAHLLGLAAAVVVLGVQCWHASHLGAWTTDPDRYEVAPLIEYVRDFRRPSDAVVFQPRVLREMGYYLDLPITAELDRALYAPAGTPRHQQLREELYDYGTRRLRDGAVLFSPPEPPDTPDPPQPPGTTLPAVPPPGPRSTDATWLIIGLVNEETRQDQAIAVAQLLARMHGLDIPRADWANLIRPNRAVRVRFSAGGAEYQWSTHDGRNPGGGRGEFRAGG